MADRTADFEACEPLRSVAGRFMRRPGATLIEVLIVFAILALLTGLILAAVQKARIASLQASSSNNLRQIILGVHQLADNEEGRIKKLAHQSIKPDGKTWYSESSVFFLILPWTYGHREIPRDGSIEKINEFLSPQVSVYRSPADPSWDYMPTMADARGKCSYVANMQVFNGSMTFPMSIPDGTSSTLSFAEHYYMCIVPGTSSLNYTAIFNGTGDGFGTRRATFADKGWSDVLPATDPATKRTVASVRGKTFQVRPRVEEADHRIPQTPFPAGLPVALFDGSVRTLSPSIDESVFWSLVTPNGGEVIGDY